MRIAFYAPMKPPDHPVPSGDRRVARLLIAALRHAGHEVELACRLRVWDDGTRSGRQERLAALSAKAARLLAARWRRRPAAARPALWFTYHLYHKAPDTLGPAVATALGLPYVAAEASFAPRRAEGPWAFGHRAAARAIAGADSVIALSRDDTACLAPLLAGPERLALLAPPIDAAPYAGARTRRAEYRRAFAARHALPETEPWLLAVGMMRPGAKQKSYRLLARALDRLRDRPWRLVAIGDGPCRDCVEASFAALPVERLRFLGALDEASLPGWYAAADLLVWPAIEEAYGMTLLEAGATGLPVVAGRTGGVPDIVNDGETGLLPPVGDIDAFAGAVAALLDDPPRRKAMGAAARAKVAAGHDLPVLAARLDAILAGAVRRRHG